MIQDRIEMVYSDLTKSEKEIADYILDNITDIGNISSYQLAYLLNIGQTTVIRFVKKMGFKNYRDFSIALCSSSQTTTIVDDIQTSDSISMVNKKIAYQLTNIIQTTIQHNPIESYEKAIQLLDNARHVVCFGSGNSNLFAQFLANHLITMGRTAFTNTNSHIIYSMIDTLDERDVLVILSESGKSDDVVRAAMLAKNKKMNIISLTKVGKNPLHELSDVVLKTVNYNSNKRLSALTIRSSHLCLIDVLCMNLVKRDYSYYKNKIDRSSRITDNNLK